MRLNANTLNRYAAIAMIGFCAMTGHAATVTATSCAQSAVQAAINAAGVGDAVVVPAGTCTWAGITLNKGIHLQGSGASNTRIAMTGPISMSKHSTWSVALSGFSLSSDSSRILVVDGSWTDAPPLIFDNVFTVSGNGNAIRYETNGGVIYRNTFNGTWNESGIQHKAIGQSASWTTADTMGTKDADGRRNLYVEDNVFNNLTNQGTDFDDNSRVVFRYNTMNFSSFNSHGLDTSEAGIRHFEIYNNSFTYTGSGVNQNWQIWLRGGTGVIYANRVDPINYGSKTELQFSVRAAQTPGQYPGGCCTTYPCLRQIGQNTDGTRSFTDPVRMWGNTGVLTSPPQPGSWGLNEWPQQCNAPSLPNFVQEGRDLVFASTPKAGYAAYAYPHPARAGARQAPPAAATLPAPLGLSVR
jgi:hypothetical protein